MKSGFVAIVGRPSAGKSTLLNALCGNKIAITAASPQTTRNVIRGIFNMPQGQVVFLDTPGYHQSGKKLNSYLRNNVHQALDSADFILYVVDGMRMPGDEEFAIMKLLGKAEIPIIAVVNKMDAQPRYIPEIRGLIRLHVNPADIVNISALKTTNLDSLKAAILNACPEGELLYPTDIITDQHPEFRIAEIIREQAISRSRQELPHSLYVEISDMEFASPQARTLWVRAFITVEQESQIGIIVGHQGSRIKEIRNTSLKEMNRVFPWKIQLSLRVKKQTDWRKNDSLLKRLTH